MNEFAKHKIAFSVAFLAVLFSISPLLKEIGHFGYSVFGVLITINHLYYCVSIIFALSVYAYGIQFLSEKGIRAASTTGNAFYALAMTTPWLYGALFLVVLAVDTFENQITPLILNVIVGVLGAFIGAIGVRLVYIIQAKLADKEQEATNESLSKEESLYISRALELLTAKHYDLAVIEAFKAIEASAKKALFDKGINFQPTKWVKVIFQEKLLPTELSRALDIIWQARNKAAHGMESVSPEQANELVSSASRIVAVLGSTRNVT